MLSKLKCLTTFSLDAPLVAVSWETLLFREFGNTLHWHYGAIVFLSVWLGYAADRWFDNRRRDAPQSSHHRFMASHEKPVAIIWILVLCSAVCISIVTLKSAEFLRGLLLMCLALLYTLFAQKGRNLPRYPLLKSSFTGLLVLASSLLFLSVPESFQATAFLPFAAIWLLFTANCLLIRSWSRPAETGNENAAIRLLLLVFAVAFLLISLGFTLSGFSCALSSLLLLALNKGSGKLRTDTSRTFADICLLSPLIILLLSSGSR